MAGRFRPQPQEVDSIKPAELGEVFTGGLNNNAVYRSQIGHTSVRLVEREPRSEDDRERTLTSIVDEYDRVGALKQGISVRLRGIYEQSVFMRRAKAAGLKSLDYIDLGESSMVLPFVEGVPFSEYVQQPEDTINKGVVSNVLAHLSQAHSLDIVFGDRWAKNTIITPDDDFIELDFDLELSGDPEVVKAFELAQMIYHTLHFAGSNRALIADLITGTYKERPELLASYNIHNVIGFLQGYTAHFHEQYKVNGELYEDIVPPFRSCLRVLTALEDFKKLVPVGQPTNSHAYDAIDDFGPEDLINMSRAIAKRSKADTRIDDLHAARHEFLDSAIVPSDLVVHAGRGAILQTNRGELIDLASMTVNCILGQNDPWVNANVMAYMQAGKPSFLTTRLASAPYYKVANRLLEISGYNHGVINHRQTNGSDVTELAIAAAYREREEGQRHLVSFRGSYHGQNLTTIHASDLLKRHAFMMEESPVIFLDQPSDDTAPEAAEVLTSNDKQLLEQFEAVADRVFGVIVEPIQVNSGVRIISRPFLQGLREACQRQKVALIYDEVQTGCGWLGEMTAAQHLGVQPDLLALSKALTAGNGPLAALISTEGYQRMPTGSTAKTNGADLRSLIAADAVMDRLFGVSNIDEIPENCPLGLRQELTRGLLADFAQKSGYLESCLQGLVQENNEQAVVLKGKGLIRGLQLFTANGEPDMQRTASVQSELLSEGVLVRHSGNTLIIKPPIVAPNAKIEEGVTKLSNILQRQI